MKKIFLKVIIGIVGILTVTFSTVYATDNTNNVELPSSYDLRNDIKIKVDKQFADNEEEGAVCYHYAKVKMIETYLQKTRGINYNLSETFYACRTEDGKYVLESEFPNKLFSQISNIEEKKKVAEENAVITDFEYDSNFNKYNMENIKNYIQNYGGILVTTYTDKQWNNYKGGIYRKEAVKDGFHAVVIIGWNDNYSKNNFVYEKPENNGAWLILNSWGANWGNNGTAWVSYEDYYNLDGTEFIKSITLNTGEVIGTEKKEEEIKRQKEQEEQARQHEERMKEIEEQNRQQINKHEDYTIIIILAIILIVAVFLIGLVFKKREENEKDESILRKIIKIILKIIKRTFIIITALILVGFIIIIIGLFIT